MSSPIRRTSGFRGAERPARRGRPALRAGAAVACALVMLSQQGCIYSFRAGSFPSYIRTIAVLPFENETTRLELTQELHDVLRDVPGALGVSAAAEDVADAVLRGRIIGYNVTTPSYRPGPGGDRAEVLQRQVTVSIAVEIVDRVRNEILWESRTLSGEGQYLEASETEDAAMIVAVRLLRQRIVDGAQSNW